MMAMIPPEEIKSYQDLLKYALLNASLTMEIQIKDVEAAIEKLWPAIWNRHMQAWLIYRNDRIIGIVLTKVTRDDLLDLNELLVYCIYIVEGFSMALEEWDQCYNYLSGFGCEMGGRWITSYTTVERVRRMASRMGGTIDTTYTRVPIQRSQT